MRAGIIVRGGTLFHKASMLWQVYFRNCIVYVPTVARTDAGFFMDVEPLEAVPVTDRRAVEQAIERAVSRGNPVMPTPSRATSPPPHLRRAR